MRASTRRSRRSRRSCAPWGAAPCSGRRCTDGSAARIPRRPPSTFSTHSLRRPRSVTVLAGGVGAARFLTGLTRLVDARRVTVIGNTGDDEEFHGLHVAPDLDTVLYTLTGRADPARGWGLRGDTANALGALAALGAPSWFRLGDRDLATHLLRTRWLREGLPLSAVTRRLARAYGLRARLLPMSDDRVRTFVHTGAGRLPFQEYLVRHRARGRVRRIELGGAAAARPAPGVLAAIRDADAIVIAPSNPLVSIAPILAVRGL